MKQDRVGSPRVLRVCQGGGEGHLPWEEDPRAAKGVPAAPAEGLVQLPMGQEPICRKGGLEHQNKKKSRA